MILKVYWDGLWTLCVGLSQVHGHGSWLVCEVALSITAELLCGLWIGLAIQYLGTILKGCIAATVLA